MRSANAISRQASPKKFASPADPSFANSALMWAKRLAIPALLVAIAFTVYVPSLKFSFILDDHRFTGDPRIQESGHFFDYFSNYVWAQFTGGPPSFYRPVFVLWMRLNYMISDLSPWGWHLLSIVKHLLVAIAFGLLVYRLLRDRVAAFAAATLFVLHPSHTESVSWVTVPDPLLTLGLMLSLLFYLRYADGSTASLPIKKPQKAKREAGGSLGIWLMASAAAYFAALLAKETAIVFPAVILVAVIGSEGTLADGEKGSAKKRSGAKQRLVPLLVVFGGTTLVYLLLRWNALDGKLAAPTQHLPSSTIILSWPATLWFYVKVLLWPVKSYSFADPTLVDHFSLNEVVAPLLGLICCGVALAAVSVWMWRTAQKESAERDAARIKFGVLAGILLLILPLLLALNLNALNPGDFLHGRYVYLPLAGFCMLFATGVHLTRRFRPVLMGIALAAAIAFLPFTWTQEKQWQDDSSVFTTAHQLAPHNVPVAKNLENTHVRAALLIADDGRCGEAMPVFNEAIHSYPEEWYAWAGRGICLVQSNDLVAAEEAFHRAADLSHDPTVIQQWQALRAHMGLPTSSPVN